MGKHFAARSPRNWSRRGKVIGGVAGVLVVALTVGAVALFIVRGPIGGGGNIKPGTPVALNVTALTVKGQSDSGFICTASAAGGVGTVNFKDALAGSKCSIDVTVTHPRGTDFGLKLADAKWVPEYVDAKIGPGSAAGSSFICGSPLGNGTSHTFQLHLTVRDDVPVAGVPSFTADPVSAGIYAKDDATGCPAA